MVTDAQALQDVRLSRHVQHNSKPLNDARFPAVIFSHGLLGNRFSNSFQNASLASNGYVVFALEHRDGTASVTFSLCDKNLKSYQWYDDPGKLAGKELNKEVFIKRKAQLASREADVLTVQEYLSRHGWKNVEESRKPALVGHSFGGATVFSSYLKGQDKFATSVGLDTWTFMLSDREIASETKGTVGTVMSEEFMRYPKVARKVEAFANQSLFVPENSNHMSIGSDLCMLQGAFPEAIVPYCKQLDIEIDTKGHAKQVATDTVDFILQHLNAHFNT